MATGVGLRVGSHESVISIMTGRGRLAQQPLGEEGAKDLAQIVEVEQHQAHDDDQQIPVRDEVLQAGHRADLECQPIARG